MIEKQIEGLKDEIKALRYLLWSHHAIGHMLYGDDGEMQCNTCLLDFKRDPIQKICNKFFDDDLKYVMEVLAKENDPKTIR